jgi:HEPN domain-containing protein
LCVNNKEDPSHGGRPDFARRTFHDETRTWISYADENLDVAELSFDHGHLNACLQNVQQAVEKYLKAVIVERDLEFRRTHSIRELLVLLAGNGIALSVSEDEMDLMDSIYIPSNELTGI